MFLCHVNKGKQLFFFFFFFFFFHFASLANLNFSKWGQIFLEDRILSFDNWPIKKEGKKENGRVSFPERVSIHLQCRAA